VFYARFAGCFDYDALADVERGFGGWVGLGSERNHAISKSRKHKKSCVGIVVKRNTT
jgi:hypothetical protein